MRYIIIPEASGQRVHSRISLQITHSDTTSVAQMSGYVAAADAERLGFDDFLANPISFTKLESQVKEKLNMA